MPLALIGATNFSDDRDVLDPISIVRLLKSQKHMCDRLIQATSIPSRTGRRRDPGHWTLAYLAFLAAKKYSDIEPWWTTAAANPTLWRECGFKNGRPPYPTVYAHFVELEQFAAELQTTVIELLKLAQKGSGGLVGRDIHVDSCEEETHARLVHDCQAGEPCKREENIAKSGKKWTRGGRRAPVSPPYYPERDTCHHAGQQRGKLAEDHPFEADKNFIGAAKKVEIVDRGGRDCLRVFINGCWYRSLDTEAGIRAYSGRNKKTFRFWHGFYNTKAIDHYTGSPVAIVIASASAAEHHIYEVLLERTTAAVGNVLRAIVADKGFSVESVFRLNTMRGIFTVIPFRRGNKKTREEYETDEYDQFGIPKCKHCGNEGVFVSFTRKPKPRLFYRCSINCPAAGGRRQSINCERKWRFLVPLWCSTALYQALLDSHQTYERVHAHMRRRYHVGGDSVDGRVTRLGLGARQLRANGALVIEWLTICWREGWLGSTRRNMQTAKAKSGARLAAAFAARRAHLRGVAAVAAATAPIGAAGPAPPGASP